MFWGAFSYNKKGPYYCWALETAQERAASKKAIKKINKELKPVMREQQELNNGMQRL